jgi:hypothetical protein
MVSFLLATVLAAPQAKAGFFSDLVNGIKNWLGNSPLSGIFSSKPSNMEISLTFYPGDFNLNYEDSINISSETAGIDNFRGTFEIKPSEGFMLKQKNSDLVIQLKTENLTINNIRINEISLENTKLNLVSGNWNETSENGSIMIKNFVGKAFISRNKIEMTGNVSSLEKK